MPTLTFLYGSVLMLVLIVCALVHIVAPKAGREIAKRAAVSVLFFLSGTYVLQCPSVSLIGRAAVGGGAVLLMASLLYLVYPAEAGKFLGRAASLGVVLVVVYGGFKWLWADHIGRAVIGFLGIVFTALILVIFVHRRRNQ